MPKFRVEIKNITLDVGPLAKQQTRIVEVEAEDSSQAKNKARHEVFGREYGQSAEFHNSDGSAYYRLQTNHEDYRRFYMYCEEIKP